jgi:hypothetical protein
MFGILVFGLLMLIMTVVFWYYELKPYLKARRTSTPQTKSWEKPINSITNIGLFFVKGKYFLIDVICTAICIQILGFGNTVSGGILGLAFSNAISVLIITIQRQDERKQNTKYSN